MDGNFGGMEFKDNRFWSFGEDILQTMILQNSIRWANFREKFGHMAVNWARKQTYSDFKCTVQIL